MFKKLAGFVRPINPDDESLIDLDTLKPENLKFLDRFVAYVLRKRKHDEGPDSGENTPKKPRPSGDDSTPDRGMAFYLHLIENQAFSERCKILSTDLEDAILNAFENLPAFYPVKYLIQIQVIILLCFSCLFSSWCNNANWTI